LNWSDASFTLDGRHRWELVRTWGKRNWELGKNPVEGYVLWVMLNPSMAGAWDNDPTIRRCMGFAQRWGYGGIKVMNLFSLVTPHPNVLYGTKGDLGPFYMTRLRLASLNAARTVVGWGALRPQERVLARRQEVMATLHEPHCLGVTQGGHPRHPLYVPYAQELVRYAG
jgi:hypothetical protein